MLEKEHGHVKGESPRKTGGALELRAPRPRATPRYASITTPRTLPHPGDPSAPAGGRILRARGRDDARGPLSRAGLHPSLPATSLMQRCSVLRAAQEPKSSPQIRFTSLDAARWVAACTCGAALTWASGHG